MARFRTVALGAAFIAATAGAVSAQNTQGTVRPDSVKAGEIRKAQPGQRRGEKMRAGSRRGIERGMRGKAGAQGMRGHGMAHKGGQRRPGMEFMRGLNLTPTQRTQVQAIHEKYQPQMKVIRDRTRTDFEATREARQRGDTAAVRATLQRTRQANQSQLSTLHEQMLREVRVVLTAEQRAKLDTQISARIKRLDDGKARLERMRR